MACRSWQLIIADRDQTHRKWLKNSQLFPQTRKLPHLQMRKRNKHLKQPTCQSALVSICLHHSKHDPSRQQVQQTNSAKLTGCHSAVWQPASGRLAPSLLLRRTVISSQCCWPHQCQPRAAKDLHCIKKMTKRTRSLERDSERRCNSLAMINPARLPCIGTPHLNL